MAKRRQQNYSDGVTHGLQPGRALPDWLLARLFRDHPGNSFLLNDPCPYCYRRSNTIEHVEPLSLGGPNHYGNKVGACAECNNRRSSQPLMLWVGRGKFGKFISQATRDLQRQWGYPKRHAGWKPKTKFGYVGPTGR